MSKSNGITSEAFTNDKIVITQLINAELEKCDNLSLMRKIYLILHKRGTTSISKG